MRWRGDPDSRLLWIKGDPGKGKTMLLCGIINELTDQTTDTNLAFFFCQATDDRINHAAAVLRGLIYLLVDKQKSLISHIWEKYEHAGKTLFEDVNAWYALSDILTRILQDPGLQDTYLIVDALDECGADRDLLLDLIVQTYSSTRAKWIVSSRNWPDIEEKLNTASHKVGISLELNEKSITDAVQKYIQYKIEELARVKNYNRKIRDAVEHHLVSNANDTFLWVALACRELATVQARHVRTKLNALPPGLDCLYERMVDQIHESPDKDLCEQILALAFTTYRPITVDELRHLVELPEDFDDDESLEEIIKLCGSFLTLRMRTIYFLHQSAKDFLQSRADNDIFPAGLPQIHLAIYSRSIEVMSGMLRRDMYSLSHPGSSIDEIQRPDPDPLSSSSYSCIYWVEHFCDAISGIDLDEGLQDYNKVEKFLRNNYLYWLEALSLLRNMPSAIISMSRLLNTIQVCFSY